MKKYLVVGNPIEHSLSPDIHNYWFSKNKINASYEKRLIQTENIPEIMSLLRDGNLNGINITVPYKKDFVQLVDSLSLEAKETNSVNTIFKKEHVIYIINPFIFSKHEAFSNIFSCKESSCLKSGPIFLKNISGFLLIVPTAEQGASITITSYFLLLSNSIKSSFKI